MNVGYSVVVCTHNRSQILPQALGALDKVQAPSHAWWELIVVDNASTDGTEKVVREFSRRSKVPVRYIREERLGRSFALKTGISESRGEIIANTDDDAMPCSDWLVRLDEAFSTYQAGIVFGPVTPVWESGPPRWFSARFRGGFALLDYGEIPFLVADKDHPFFGVNHACRKSVVRDLGGYREDLGAFGRRSRVGEDQAFFLRALEAGVRIAYQPSAVVGHIIPASRCTKADLRRRIWQNRESEYRDVHEKYGGSSWLLGLPRWFFLKALGNAVCFARSICSRNSSESFFYELLLRRFVVHLFQASLHGFGMISPTGSGGVHESVSRTNQGIDPRSSECAAGDLGYVRTDSPR
jgi:glucosyl-dolichyl phosphate glucuronosyltransferase